MADSLLPLFVKVIVLQLLVDLNNAFRHLNGIISVNAQVYSTEGIMPTFGILFLGSARFMEL